MNEQDEMAYSIIHNVLKLDEVAPMRMALGGVMQSGVVNKEPPKRITVYVETNGLENAYYVTFLRGDYGVEKLNDLKENKEDRLYAAKGENISHAFPLTEKIINSMQEIGYKISRDRFYHQDSYDFYWREMGFEWN